MELEHPLPPAGLQVAQLRDDPPVDPRSTRRPSIRPSTSRIGRRLRARRRFRGKLQWPIARSRDIRMEVRAKIRPSYHGIPGALVRIRRSSLELPELIDFFAGRLSNFQSSSTFSSAVSGTSRAHRLFRRSSLEHRLLIAEVAGRLSNFQEPSPNSPVVSRTSREAFRFAGRLSNFQSSLPNSPVVSENLPSSLIAEFAGRLSNFQSTFAGSAGRLWNFREQPYDFAGRLWNFQSSLTCSPVVSRTSRAAFRIRRLSLELPEQPSEFAGRLSNFQSILFEFAGRLSNFESSSPNSPVVSRTSRARRRIRRSSLGLPQTLQMAP